MHMRSRARSGDQRDPRRVSLTLTIETDEPTEEIVLDVLRALKERSRLKLSVAVTTTHIHEINLAEARPRRPVAQLVLHDDAP